MFEKLTEKLDSFLDMGVPFYDCIVMKDGKCVYRRMNGYTDVKNRIKPTGKEIYNIYSCSKLITCVAALQLWEKGLYSLEDKLSDYMPEFSEMTVIEGDKIVAAKNPILIKHLFEMTAGFSYNRNSPMFKKCMEDTDGKCPTRETMKYLAKDPLLFEPGTRWEYSLCTDVLAALVEVLSGKTFGQYVEENVFKPLGMNNSTFIRKGYDMQKIVGQYRYTKEEGLTDIGKGVWDYVGTEYESGGAGAISTVEDYIKLEEALRVGDVILKKETVDLIATNRLTEKQAETFWSKEFYGYGLGQKCPKDKNRTEFGWGGMAGAYYAIDRQNGITFFLGTQIFCPEYQEARKKIYSVIKDEFKNC